jgi:hypothetical protein
VFAVRDPFERVNKRREEHGYNMTYVETNDVEFQVMGSCASLGIPGYSRNWASTEGFSANPHRSWDSNDDLALIGKLRERIQGSDFNLATFLAEGRESLSTIANAASRIYRAAKSLRKGDVVSAGRHLLVDKKRLSKNLAKGEVTEHWFASNWLQLQYGWLPLIHDVFSATQHLAAMQSRPMVMNYRAMRKLRGTPVPGTSGWIASGSSILQGQFKAKLTHINEAALVGLEDPLSTAWELVPYSFVADWFLPIGDYLSASALSRALTGTFVKTRFDRVHLEGMTRENLPGSDPVFWVFPLESWFHRYGTLERVVTTSLEVPLPSFKGRDKIASWVHAINSVALLTNAFPRFGNR